MHYKKIEHEPPPRAFPKMRRCEDVFLKCGGIPGGFKLAGPAPGQPGARNIDHVLRAARSLLSLYPVKVKTLPLLLKGMHELAPCSLLHLDTILL